MKLTEKIGFALTNLGNIPIMTLLNTYLLIFYTDVIEVSPATVGTIFLVSRLLDGVSDPIIGFLIDRFPRMKMGKYKPILILGTIVCCINYLFVWFAPLLVNEQKILVISISYILLGVTFDLMDIPLNSMIPVLTKDDNERNILSSIKGISYTVGPIILNIVAPLILSAATKKVSGYLTLITGTVCVVLFFTIVGALCLKENYSDEELRKEKYGIKDAFKIIKVRPVFSLFLTMLFVTAASNIFNGTILFYVIYVLGNEKYFSLASFIGIFGVVVAGLIVPYVSKKIGKKNLYITGLVIMMGMMLLMIPLSKNVGVFLVAYLFIQVGLGFTNTIQYSISADNVDYVKAVLGVESAGLLASLNSLVMKFAMAIGGAIPGFILSYSGYVANQKQSISATSGIVMTAFLIPFFLYLIATLIFKIGYKKVSITE